jgi:hypothetical protein
MSIEGSLAHRVGVRRRRALTTPRTALVVGTLAAVLGVASIPIAALVHDLTVSRYLPALVAFTAFAGVGGVVAYKRPENRMGWMLLAVGAFGFVNEIASGYSVLDYRIHHGRLPLGRLAVLLGPTWAPYIVLVVAAILLYPDGRLPTPRWKWPRRWVGTLAGAWVLGAFAIAASAALGGPVRVSPAGDLIAINKPTGHWAWWGVVQNVWFLTLVILVIAWVAAQLLGYRRLSRERRAQQKWIISGAAVCAASGIATLILPQHGNGFLAVLGGSLTVGLAGLPVAMGVGILRYRLYEIDRLVSRTLSYAVLTALLVGAFVGLVVLTTDVLPFSSSVGVAASTLVAAALFNPLRGRVQRVVDRRFNRARYDAEATVSAFAARLRDVVDLDAVQSELLEVVQRTVEPAHATVWLRQHGEKAGR